MPTPESFVFFDTNNEAYRMKGDQKPTTGCCGRCSKSSSICLKRTIQVSFLLLLCAVLALGASLLTHFYLADLISGQDSSSSSSKSAALQMQQQRQQQESHSDSLAELNRSLVDVTSRGERRLHKLQEEVESDRDDLSSYKKSVSEDLAEKGRELREMKAHVEGFLKNVSERTDKEESRAKSEMESVRGRQDDLEEGGKDLEKRLNETAHHAKIREEHLNSSLASLKECVRKKESEMHEELEKLNKTIRALAHETVRTRQHLSEVNETLTSSFEGIAEEIEAKLSGELASNVSKLVAESLHRNVSAVVQEVRDLLGKRLREILEQHNRSLAEIDANLRDHFHNESREQEGTDGAIGSIKRDLNIVNASLFDMWQNSVSGRLRSIEQALQQLSEEGTKKIPTGSVKIGESYYGFFLQQHSLERAELSCRNNNFTHLVEFQSKDTYDKILAAAKEKGLRTWWIGATDVDTEGHFTWRHSGQAMKYTNWSEGEPNNFKHDEQGEDCVQVYTDSGKWNDVSCTSTQSYVCQYL